MIFSNAWHPDRGYYNEWWYFALLCGSGDIIAGNFKIQNKRPKVWLFLKTKDGKSQYLEQEYKFKDFSAAKDFCRVKIGDNKIEQKGNDFSLRVKLKNFDLSVAFQPAVDWKNNVLKKDISRKQKVFWIVPCLRGSFAGTLNDGKQVKKIKGIVYHDHVWHNITFTSAILGFKEWLWGICYIKNGSILFGNIRFAGKNFSILSVEKDGVVRSTNKEINPEHIIWVRLKNSLKVRLNKKNLLTAVIQKKEKIAFAADNRFLSFFTKKIFHIAQAHCTIDCLAGKSRGQGYMETLSK